MYEVYRRTTEKADNYRPYLENFKIAVANNNSIVTLNLNLETAIKVAAVNVDLYNTRKTNVKSKYLDNKD